MNSYIIIILLILLPLICYSDGGQDDYHTDLGGITQESEHFAEDGEFDKIYDLIIDYARSGNPEAQFSIGIILGLGYGYKATPSIESIQRCSLNWIVESAKSGHEKGIKFMIDAYKNGWRGLRKDEYLSECWINATHDKTYIDKCIGYDPNITKLTECIEIR
jgi:hypothetical protein